MKKTAGTIAAIFVMSAALAFSVFADEISDMPYPVAETSAAAQTAGQAPPPVSSDSSAAVSSGSTALVSSGSGTAVITDSPDGSGVSAGESQAPVVSVSAGTSSSDASGTGSGVTPGAVSGTTAGTADASASDAGPYPGTTAAPAVSEVSAGSDSSGGTGGQISSGMTSADPGPGSIAAGSAGPGAAGSVSSGVPSASSSSGVPGGDHAGDPRARVDLGFIVVSPAVDYNGFKVAEGSVQLSDGSWESIGHDKYIRQPYFRLLREEGDWYIVSVHGSRIGSHSTSDGTVARELWLKKSECTASGSIDLQTTSSQRQQIVKTALSLLGKGYQYAGSGPDYYDCSGFVKAVMASAGITVPRTSTELCNAGTPVGIAGLRPGDIVGRPGHVGIYIGDGYFVHASESNAGIISESLQVYNTSSPFTCYNNVIGD